MIDKPKRDKLEITSPIGGITDEQLKDMYKGLDDLLRVYLRYRCIDIASQMDVHGNANEVVARAKKFMCYVLEEEEKDDN